MTNIHPLTSALPRDLQDEVQASLEQWSAEQKLRRLWERDASLWTGRDESQWLGWLDVAPLQRSHVHEFQSIAGEAKTFSHALLLGMGGSSLSAEVMQHSFGRIAGFPQLLVLDSTDPAQVHSAESKIDLAKTLFIVSSKSGTTLEPNLLLQYFFERVREVVGGAAGERFVAITDPGSSLQQVAEALRFRRVFFGIPSIGGRYSALSDFGMVPAAILGVDIEKFLRRTEEMVAACAADVPVGQNPAAILGTVLAVAARRGRDKVTLLVSPPFTDVGAWLEQLLAESTGKKGQGLIPVDREPPGPPEAYANDRLFIYLGSASQVNQQQDAEIEALQRAAHPVLRIAIPDAYNLGQEFFRWEMATAVAGAIMGINPFDQPDVEASKIATRQLTSAYENEGSLPKEKPIFEGEGIQLFCDKRNAAVLAKAAGPRKSLAAYLRALIQQLAPGDYFALLAFLEMNPAHEEQLQLIRRAVRDKTWAATCLGFGPRFLHSTGQAYKGGPNTGVFLQITCDDAHDIAVPGQKFSFGIVKAAQARGDFEVLAQRQRRLLRVHLGSDVSAGLHKLNAAIQTALA